MTSPRKDPGKQHEDRSVGEQADGLRRTHSVKLPGAGQMRANRPPEVPPCSRRGQGRDARCGCGTCRPPRENPCKVADSGWCLACRGRAASRGGRNGSPSRSEQRETRVRPRTRDLCIWLTVMFSSEASSQRQRRPTYKRTDSAR